MELPKQLAPFALLASLFPPEIADVLGGLARRLSLAIGPFRSTASRGHEPDGYDGLSRRGSYERLLASEWLLADEAPDEFLRRAASMEHAFLELRRVDPAAAKRSVALFDAGPEQLGGPRLVHVAAMVALANRAHVARVPFFWGIAQKPAALVEGIGAASILALLRARTSTLPTKEHADAWDQKLVEEGAKPDDVDAWIVGGARAMRAFATSRVRIEDTYEIAQTRLRIEVAQGKQTARVLEVQLPNAEIAAKLLRDPFTDSAIRTRRTNRGAIDGVVITGSGRRLVTRDTDGSLTMHTIARSTRHPGKDPIEVLLTKNEWPVAATSSRQGLQLVSVRDDVLVVRRTGSRGGMKEPTIVAMKEGASLPSTKGFSPILRTPSGSLLFVDADERLFEARSGELRHVGVQALFGSSDHHGLALLRHGPQMRLHSALRDESSFRTTNPFVATAARVTPGFFEERVGPTFATRRRVTWTIRVRGVEDVAELTPDAGLTVVGALEDDGEERERRLLCRTEDRLVLLAIGLRGSRELLRAPTPIAHVVLSPGAEPLVAVVTDDHRIVVLNLRQGEVVYRAEPR